ncbi:MAG TPA: TetR/AcrR family transcriptional regulator [Thermoanaerobaculia bacterium]|nr:TetR/AcrR family transcriptional regulator [Thermoanaerobaculia bacterium]
MGRRPKVSRDDVLRAAREAFAERGFEGTTLATIAGRLDVSPAALLRHAPTKEALFAAAMDPAEGDAFHPLSWLAECDGSEEPRKVLRRLGEVLVPFIEGKLDGVVARWMRAKSLDDARAALPVELTMRPTPPERGLALLEDYIGRAVAAGRLRVSDRRAAAFTLLGSLHSFVVLHRIGRILDPPLPLDRYLDTLLEIWLHGAAGAKRSDGVAGAENKPEPQTPRRPSGAPSPELRPQPRKTPRKKATP